VITLLFFIDFLTPGGWWFYWALLGWGIGILAHALSVFGITGLFGSDWEEKKIAELMNKTNKD
jgi:2TM domain